jgi:uncharacterized protein
MSKYWVFPLLLLSNCFMTYAWYGHLKDAKNSALWLVVLLAWGIAFFEYVLQVPANRLGHQYFSTVELKTIQEVMSLTVFMLFSVFYMKEAFTWNYLVGFALISAGAYIIFMK